jgi:hypothetical protein
MALLAAGSANAEVQPIVRVDLAPSAVSVGESARLRVTVLVPTWFAKPPVYPDFELAGAITRLPADSSYPTSERVGSETWSGIVRNYRVYPLLGATYRLSGESIRVAYANPGAAPVTVDVPVPEIVFRGTVPAGAEDLDPYLAGRSLMLTLEAEGDVGALAAGDAIVVRYAAELDGLPAMFLPPLAATLEHAGVSVYPAEPDVEDGEPARRVEKLTLVFETGGTFEVPGIEIDYWNTATQAIETASAAGFTLDVAGPLPAPDETEPADGAGMSRIAAVTAGLLLFSLAAWHAGPRLLRRRREALLRRRQSESSAFDELIATLPAGEPRSIHAALVRWLQRLEPNGDARQFAGQFGDKELVRAIESLLAAGYARTPVNVERAALRRGLREARRRCLQESRAAAQPAPLPAALNP